MRAVHLMACACALVALPAHADIILVSGNVTNFSSDDPVLAAQQPTAFRAIGTFRPDFFLFSQAALFGNIDWMVALDTGSVLTNTAPQPLGPRIFGSGLREWVAPGGSSTAYSLFDDRTNGATTPPFVSYSYNLTAYTGAPFDIFTGDPTRPTSLLSLLVDFRAAAAAGVRSGTFTIQSNFGTDTTLFTTGLAGSVAGLQIIPQSVPEPGTLAAAALGAALVLAWNHLRTRPANRSGRGAFHATGTGI